MAHDPLIVILCHLCSNTFILLLSSAGPLKCKADVVPASPAAVMAAFPSVHCPLSQVLNAINKTETERECAALLREITTKVNEEVEGLRLAPYLGDMDKRKRVWHFMKWTRGDEQQKYVLTAEDFFSALDAKAQQFYSNHVVLHRDPKYLAADTLGQSENERYVLRYVVYGRVQNSVMMLSCSM